MENIVEKEYKEAVKGLTLETLNNSSAWYDYALNLPITQQIVYTIVLFHSQVENGGFHQYFFNSYGQFAYLTLKNLKTIGGIKRAKLLDDALRHVNGENLPENIFRKLVVNRKLSRIVDFKNELFDYLNNLDNKYYDIEGEDIYELLEKYLKESR